ncbi:MAG: hypothetical protein CMM93_04935 [Rickettsiales bacterium]|nr:hypothetical protein [Rickettsiales bacterium]
MPRHRLGFRFVGALAVCMSLGCGGGVPVSRTSASSGAASSSAGSPVPPEARGEATEPGEPEPLETAIRFSAGWVGPCHGTNVTRGGAPLEYRYERAGGCVIPFAAVVTGVYGCVTSASFADEERVQEYTYDDQGRLIDDGLRRFHWEGTRLVATSRAEDRGAVMVTDGVVTDQRTGETIEVGSDGFPFIARATASAIARDDLEYDEAWRLRRLVYGAPSMFTVELSYCDDDGA